MPNFALKGAGLDLDQLMDRAERLHRLGLPIRLELHTFGGRDLDTADGPQRIADNLDQVRDRYGLDMAVVHVPYQSVEFVTSENFDSGQVRQSIDLAHKVGAAAVVLHRYWGLVFGNAPARTTRQAATAAFNDTVKSLARDAGGMTLLVENVGHYSLLPRDGENYLSGPLDHFFPWEIADFRAFLRTERLTNVDVFVDVAHATLTSNLFNRRRHRLAETAADPRFFWVLKEDLERADRLDPFDFVDPAMPYLHVSDSVQLDDAALAAPVLATDQLVTGLCSEGMEVGTGTLPWADLPKRLGPDSRTTMVMEVDPSPGDSHVRNGAQERSLTTLQHHFAVAGG